MSSDLSVKIQPPIDTDLLLRDAERIFSEILNVSFIAPFCFWGSSISPAEIGWGVDFDEMEFEAQPPWITTEAGVYAVVTSNGNQGMSYAVAASLMIAVAYRHNSNVIDDASRWIKFSNPLRNIRGLSAAVFQNAVTNAAEFADLDTAAGAFYKRLPVFVADPGWTD